MVRNYVSYTFFGICLFVDTGSVGRDVAILFVGFGSKLNPPLRNSPVLRWQGLVLNKYEFLRFS